MFDDEGYLGVVDRKKDMIRMGARTSPAARSR
jgi:acyl-CoA synthetase (AMP-forming)/AMP-acid ligase II